MSQLDHTGSDSESQDTVIAMRVERHEDDGDDTLCVLHGEQHNSSGACCVLSALARTPVIMKHEPRVFHYFEGLTHMTEDFI